MFPNNSNVAPSNTTPTYSEVLWELGNDNSPKNEEQFFACIKYLNEHAGWVNTYNDEAVKSFQLLEKTQYSSCKMAKTAQTMHDSLRKNYPHLFPSIKIIMGNHEAEIPIFCLQKFDTLRVLLSHANHNTIDLTDPDTTYENMNDVFNCFLNYLKSGTVALTGDNALPLLHLADKHILRELAKPCLNFLRDNLDLESFESLAHHAQGYQLKDLTWLCIEFVYNNKENKTILALNETTDETLKFCIEIGLNCYKCGVVPQFENDQRCVELSHRYGWVNWPFSQYDDVQVRDFLAQLCNQGLLSGLMIGEIPTNEMLRELATSLPNLHYLSIKGNYNITEIPQQWAENIRELECISCHQLIIFNASAAEKVDCSDCSNLTTLNAPTAKYVNCTSNSNLTTLNAPAAEILNCFASRSLTSIYVPMAKKLSCFVCPSLTKITLSRDCEISGNLSSACTLSYCEENSG